MKMPEKVDDATKRRLLYVKRLYLHGHEHISLDTEFDRMIAIHHLDNAVELLLKCVATQYNISFKRPVRVVFSDLWGTVDQSVPLPKKAEMFRLHDLRCDVQHWGTSPFSSEAARRFDVYVLDFLENVVEQVFGMTFDELYMASLLEDGILKKLLTSAEKGFEERDYQRCMEFADAALHRALRQMDPSISFLYTDNDEVDLALDEMREILTILALGINYSDYQKYEKTAPRTYFDEKEGGIMHARPLRFATTDDEEIERLKRKRFSREHALSSLNFVLDNILRWHL